MFSNRTQIILRTVCVEGKRSPNLCPHASESRNIIQKYFSFCYRFYSSGPRVMCSASGLTDRELLGGKKINNDI